MALPTLIDSGSETSTSSTISVSQPGGLSAGDLIVLSVAFHGFGGSSQRTAMSFPDSTGTFGWNPHLVRRFWPGGGVFAGVEHYVFRAIVDDPGMLPSEWVFSYLLVGSDDPDDMARPNANVAQWLVYSGPDSFFTTMRSNKGLTPPGNVPFRFPIDTAHPHWSPPIGVLNVDNEYESTTQAGDRLVVGTGYYEDDDVVNIVSPSGFSELLDAGVVGAAVQSSCQLAIATTVGDAAPARWGYPITYDPTRAPIRIIGSWTLRISETEGEVTPDPDPEYDISTKSHCDLHIPHKDWASEPDERVMWDKYRQNLLEIERWAEVVLEPSNRCLPCGEPPTVPT